MAENEATLTDRAQAYWEALSPGELITAEQLFDVVKGQKDWNEHIKYVRGFLTRKFNDGCAFLIPGHSPPTYEKLEDVPTTVDYCIKVFNFLPIGDRMTSISFSNRIPSKLQQKYAVRSFIHRSKVAGALVEVAGEDGQKEKDGKCLILEKRKNITESLPPASSIPEKYKVAAPAPERKDVTMKADQVGKLISGMTPSEVGMSIFHAIHELLAENANVKKMKSDVMLSLQATAYDLVKAEEKIKTLESEIESLKGKGKEQTFGELFRQKQPASPAP